MEYVFFFNEFSLKDRTGDVIQEVVKVANELGLNYMIIQNSENYTTEEVMKGFKDDEKIIIAVGGDGTINRVLNSIAGTKNILGFIPFGTGNDFYKSNKELLDQGINTVDLIKINKKYFINVACFGIDADIANSEKVIHSKFIPKSQRYNVGILQHFFNYKPKPLRVKINNEVINKEFTTIALCNARYYGGGYKVGTNALLDDGLLDVYLADKTSKFNMAKLIIGMKKGKHETNKSLRVLRSKKVFIESPKRITCNIDGDKLSDTRFDIEVIPKGIRVYYNQELIDKVLNGMNKTK